jgi:hypothetical protein
VSTATQARGEAQIRFGEKLLKIRFRHRDIAEIEAHFGGRSIFDLMRSPSVGFAHVALAVGVRSVGGEMTAEDAADLFEEAPESLEEQLELILTAIARLLQGKKFDDKLAKLKARKGGGAAAHPTPAGEPPAGSTGTSS